jgi:hypothetical protein
LSTEPQICLENAIFEVQNVRMSFCWIYLGVLAAALTGSPKEKLVKPLANAHAHNDYEHERPLWDALARGFCSVEADIYLVNGSLLVAHDLKDVKPQRTLEKLYLEPLRDLVEKNKGRVFPNGPSVTLLIDLKSEAESTYAALRPVLRRFEPMLTGFRHGRIETNAVTVILSGNRPRERLLAEADRLAAYDGRLADLGKGLPVSFMPLVSDNFAERFRSATPEGMTATDRSAFTAAIKAAHDEGRAIRFWATRDDRQTWKFLREAGVDFINTDNLSGLAEFLGDK